MVEVVGYVASALVVMSLAMTSVVRLRSISLAGSLVFVVYGVLIGSIPIVITNAAIAALNVWFLRAELGGKRQLAATDVGVDSPFLGDFLRYHLDDIRRFQPQFDPGQLSDRATAMVLLRDGLPAGVLIGEVADGRLAVALDYVTPAYRDSQIARWLYRRGSPVLDRLDVTRVTSAPGTEAHNSYLAKHGFRPGDGGYVLDLAE